MRIQEKMPIKGAPQGQPPAAQPSPPTRLTRRGAERCERIRSAAAELFLARGYERVSLGDIIVQAGGSKTNIYSHFGDKEGLFLAVVEELLDRSAEPVRTLDLSDCSLEEGLLRYGRTLLGCLLTDSHRALYRLVIGESVRFPSLADLWQAHGLEVSIRVLAEFLSHQQAESGRPGTVDPRRAAAQFHNMLTHDRLLCFGLERPAGEEQIDRLVREAAHLFIRGYLPPGSSNASNAGQASPGRILRSTVFPC